MTFSESYTRNFPALSEEEQTRLTNSRICIAGCGGLGGHLLSYLVRLGVGHITVIDSDCFEISNLNRQLLCTLDTIGKPKVAIAKEYANSLRPEVCITPVFARFEEANARTLLEGFDLVFDAFDSIESRRLLARTCEQLQLPLVFGAICAWSAQCALLLPSRSSLVNQLLYPSESHLSDSSCLSFTVSFCASLQAAEGCKWLLGKPSRLTDHILFIDLLNDDYEWIPQC